MSLQLWILEAATAQEVAHEILAPAQAVGAAHGAQEHVPKLQVLSLSREEVYILPHTIS